MVITELIHNHEGYRIVGRIGNTSAYIIPSYSDINIEYNMDVFTSSQSAEIKNILDNEMF